MSKWYQVTSYLKHFLFSRGVNSIHSPFVFDFAENVLHDHRHFYAYDEVEQLRSILLSVKEKLQITDFGTGSSGISPSAKTIRSILKKSVKPRRQAQLLFRMIDYYDSRQIIEVGTSLGITTIYLASAKRKLEVITLEGDPQLAERAQKNFDSLGKNNIQLLPGRFDETLQIALEQSKKVDFIFFDGDHRKESTLRYFDTALRSAHEHSIFVFDDIYWSKEMTAAWNEIQSNEKVSLSLDLYFMGILFFRKELSKQNFLLRF